MVLAVLGWASAWWLKINAAILVNYRNYCSTLCALGVWTHAVCGKQLEPTTKFLETSNVDSCYVYVCIFGR